MKTLLLANHTLAIPCVQLLFERTKLSYLILPDIKTEFNNALEGYALKLDIPILRLSKDKLDKIGVLCTELLIDVVFVFTFPFKIPSTSINKSRLGFFNIHFSLLPQFKGADPLFWQIKLGVREGGVSIHKINNQWDSGPILLQKLLPLNEGETLGVYSSRLMYLSLEAMIEALQIMTESEDLPLSEMGISSQACYPRPQKKDIQIDWSNQSASQLENLVNACNPYHGGALAIMRGQEIRILEVTKGEWNSQVDGAPGTIMISDPNFGVFVNTADGKALRIGIVQTTEGVMSGFKLASLGVMVGEKFE